ncbi:MAG: hypothetical protein ACN4ES_06030, partial [Cellulophaga baltica]
MKTKTVSKFKASSLLFTVYVSLVLYLIAGSFILLYFLYSNFLSQTIISAELKSLCESGAAYYLANSKIAPNENWVDVPVFEGKSVRLKRSCWGFFEILEAKATKGSYSEQASFFIGASKKGINALYAADNNSYLRASGKTTIHGKIIVPGGHIERENFFGEISPIGLMKKSSNSLPIFNAEILNNLPKSRRCHKKTECNSVEFSRLRQKSLSVLFTDTVLVLQSDEAINLVDVELRGKIIISSRKKIEVYSSSLLTDVILNAPEINIRVGFKGCGQFIA